MRYPLLISMILMSHIVLSQGCTPIVIAGATTGAVAAHDRRTVGAFIDDEAIELKADTAVNEEKDLKQNTHINYTSMNGVVLLTGEATNAVYRDQVLAKVRAVNGVRRVVNEIRIGPLSSLGSRSKDTWLTTKVKGKMVSTKNLDATRVKVTTENQVVYLLGLVKKQEADLATEAARTVRSVERVVKLFEYID
jgi:osmotically-inducible protein OsmY